MRIYQTPLFLQEITKYLDQVGAKTVIDTTFGEGGHGINIALEGMNVLGIEWDKDMYHNALKTVKEKGLTDKVTLHNANFADIVEIAKKHGLVQVDAVVFDLGLSMRQIALADRGFSFKKEDELLDMRISTRLKTTAAMILKSLNRQDLYELLSRYIEDVSVEALVARIVRERTVKPIRTMSDLIAVVAKLNLPPFRHRQVVRKLLQSLRMVVNSEIENIERGLKGSIELVRAGGIICVITFHSIEDRVVKLFFKDRADFISLTGKPIAHTRFPFARGAKLRVYQKI